VWPVEENTGHGMLFYGAPATAEIKISKPEKYFIIDIFLPTCIKIGSGNYLKKTLLTG
jgi:hypothetical protein